jgi:hypothetical protein
VRSDRARTNHRSMNLSELDLTRDGAPNTCGQCQQFMLYTPGLGHHCCCPRFRYRFVGGPDDGEVGNIHYGVDGPAEELCGSVDVALWMKHGRKPEEFSGMYVRVPDTSDPALYQWDDEWTMD